MKDADRGVGAFDPIIIVSVAFATVIAASAAPTIILGIRFHQTHGPERVLRSVVDRVDELEVLDCLEGVHLLAGDHADLAADLGETEQDVVVGTVQICIEGGVGIILH
jgi:hypothetical protein